MLFLGWKEKHGGMDALAMLYDTDTSQAAKLQQLVLELRSTAALAGAVRAFVSQRQAGV